MWVIPGLTGGALKSTGASAHHPQSLRALQHRVVGGRTVGGDVCTGHIFLHAL